jgi:hypothetical protein
MKLARFAPLALLLALGGVSLAGAARAENVQLPQLTSTPAALTITTAGTFQSVLAANVNRHGCTIQNTSADTEYVFFGANASATTSNALQLSPGASVSCAGNGVVLTDNVSMTSKVTNGATAVLVWQ